MQRRCRQANNICVETTGSCFSNDGFFKSQRQVLAKQTTSRCKRIIKEIKKDKLCSFTKKREMFRLNWKSEHFSFYVYFKSFFEYGKINFSDIPPDCSSAQDVYLSGSGRFSTLPDPWWREALWQAPKQNMRY